MKLLVTGAAGYIGAEVVREFLEHDYQVRALDMRPIPHELRDLGAELAYADISNPIEMLRAIDGCEGLVHIAAVPDPKNPGAIVLDPNVKGTYNALEAAHAAGIQRAIITSSVWAFGFANWSPAVDPEYLPVDEAHPKKPMDVYGFSKHVNELTADMFVRRHGMTVVTLRPGGVVNSERSVKSGWLQRAVENGAKSVRGDLWGYIDLKELASLYRHAWQAKLEPGHHGFWAMIDDVLADVTVQELIERFFPALMPYKDRVSRGFFDVTPIREKLGFTAEFTWRKALEQASS